MKVTHIKYISWPHSLLVTDTVMTGICKTNVLLSDLAGVHASHTYSFSGVFFLTLSVPSEIN